MKAYHVTSKVFTLFSMNENDTTMRRTENIFKEPAHFALPMSTCSTVLNTLNGHMATNQN